MPTLTHFLLVAVVLFCIGLAGTLVKRHAILVLIGIEIMMNAANLAVLSFWHFGAAPTAPLSGPLFVLFVIGAGAAEAAVGLALFIAVYRHYRSVNVEDLQTLRG